MPQRKTKKPVPVIPYESEEQGAVLEYCDIWHMPYFHVNNEMWTTSWKQKATAKAMGTKSGVPDLFIFIPVGRREDDSPAYQMVAIEMKRKKGSSTSKEQLEWKVIIEAAGIPHAICKGANEAIAFLKFAKQHYTKRWRRDQDQLRSFADALSAAIGENMK